MYCCGAATAPTCPPTCTWSSSPPSASLRSELGTLSGYQSLVRKPAGGVSSRGCRTGTTCAYYTWRASGWVQTKLPCPGRHSRCGRCLTWVAGGGAIKHIHRCLFVQLQLAHSFRLDVCSGAARRRQADSIAGWAECGARQRKSQRTSNSLSARVGARILQPRLTGRQVGQEVECICAHVGCAAAVSLLHRHLQESTAGRASC